MTTDEERLEEWLLTRPECVQQLAKEFPIGSTFDIDGETFHLIGWTEGDALIVSKIDPAEDYEWALECKEYFHAYHLRPH